MDEPKPPPVPIPVPTATAHLATAIAKDARTQAQANTENIRLVQKQVDSLASLLEVAYGRLDALEYQSGWLTKIKRAFARSEP